MISNLAAAGVSVPGGFATTAEAYRDFLSSNGLTDKINDALGKLDVDDVVELARVGKQIREWVVEAPLPEPLEKAVREAYAKMADGNDQMARSEERRVGTASRRRAA